MALFEHQDRNRRYSYASDGNLHGLYQSWDDNGSIRSKIQYNNGVFHGEYQYFNAGGSIFMHCWYNHGKQILDFLNGDDEYPTTPEAVAAFKELYQGEFIPK